MLLSTAITRTVTVTRTGRGRGRYGEAEAGARRGGTLMRSGRSVENKWLCSELLEASASRYSLRAAILLSSSASRFVHSFALDFCIDSFDEKIPAAVKHQSDMSVL